MKRGNTISQLPPGRYLWPDGRARLTPPPSAPAAPVAPVSLRWELPIRVVSEANQRGHWTIKALRAKTQRAAAYTALRAAVANLPLPLVVTLTRVEPRELDDDNLAGAFKAIRDGVADALGKNDRHPQIKWQYAQRKPEPGGAPGIVIEIKRLEDGK